MNLQSLQSALASPEIVIASMASIILLLGLFIQKDRSDITCFWLSVGTLIVTAVLIASDFSTQSVLAFNGLFVDDPMADLLKIFDSGG